MGLIFGSALAFLFPLIFLSIIRKIDFYQTGQPKLILQSLVWGGVAFVLGAFTNNLLLKSGLADEDAIIRTYAPVHEEIFKGLILLYLIRHPKFSYSVDGAVYGFAVGIGFAILENFEFVIHPENAAAVAWQRIFSANLVHASSSAILGIALGIFHVRRAPSRWLVFVAGLLLAIGQHTFYNRIGHGGTSLPVAFGTGLAGFAFIYLAMQFGKLQAQGWIRQKLRLDDRITPSEAAAVDHLASSHDVLLPVLERFGAEKASQVERLLYLQARLGLKRKALDSFRSEAALRNKLEAEISTMRTDMESARRAIGLYVMLFVRGLYTEEMVSLWDQMQAKIQERTALRGDQKGGSLWKSLEERVKAPTDAETSG